MRSAAFLLATLLLPAVVGGQEWRGPAALEVLVEDAKGRNIAGAEVLLVYLSPDGGGSLPSVLTDGEGKASIGGLAAGRWSVEVRHGGHMSYRAELALAADSKPSVQSASHLMAPGATSTMKVKFSRGRAGATAPAVPAPRTAPPSAPAPPIVPAAPAPTLAPAPAPVPAPTTAKAPVKELPPAPHGGSSSCARAGPGDGKGSSKGSCHRFRRWLRSCARAASGDGKACGKGSAPGGAGCSSLRSGTLSGREATGGAGAADTSASRSFTSKNATVGNTACGSSSGAFACSSSREFCTSSSAPLCRCRLQRERDSASSARRARAQLGGRRRSTAVRRPDARPTFRRG